MTSNVSMNADLPLIDISAKLIDIDRETASYSQLTTESGRALIDGLNAMDSAYVTLTSSHLDQLRRSCELSGDGNDVIRSVWLAVRLKTGVLNFIPAYLPYCNCRR